MVRLVSWQGMHGLPEHVVSDNGPQFTSAEFAEFMKANGIKHIAKMCVLPSIVWMCRRPGLFIHLKEQFCQMFTEICLQLIN